MNLPEEYMQNMQRLLSDQYDSFVASFFEKPYHGLRVNTDKISSEDFLKLSPFDLEKIPYVNNGFYYEEDVTPSKHPFYNAGLYYLQEPSAMLPGDILPISEGDMVLDLCAAPGGKSTQLLNRLKGTGFLLANDLSASRAQALLKNLELFGGRNYFVSAEAPSKIKKMGPVFDKILVDAPCSGEGMFRKDKNLIGSWLKNGPEYYSRIQFEILSDAVELLKPGGMLLYSTCTFSTLEDEENIIKLLSFHPELHMVPLDNRGALSDGFMGLNEAKRAFPHLLKGEGHFLALLQKDGDPGPDGWEYVPAGSRINSSGRKPIDKKIKEASGVFLRKLGFNVIEDDLYFSNGCLYLIDKCGEKLFNPSLRYLRTGLMLGEIDKNGRFKPSQALAMTLSEDKYPFCINLSDGDERVFKYLKGETVFFSKDEYTGEYSDKEEVLVLIDHFPLGFAKNTGNGSLKNHLKNSYIMR